MFNEWMRVITAVKCYQEKGMRCVVLYSVCSTCTHLTTCPKIFFISAPSREAPTQANRPNYYKPFMSEWFPKEGGWATGNPESFLTHCNVYVDYVHA